jgi:hypothetical protein
VLNANVNGWNFAAKSDYLTHPTHQGCDQGD